MDRRRKSLIALSFAAILLIGTVAFADQALTWSRIGKGGLAKSYNPSQPAPASTCVFEGKLYFGTGGGWSNGGQIWRYDGKAWALVHKPKPGSPRINSVGGMAVIGDYLYAGMNTNSSSCQLWRTKGGGATPYPWTKVSGPADIERQGLSSISSMTVLKGVLYLGFWAYQGCQVWKFDGSAWAQVVGQGSSGSPTGPGFGNKENYAALSMAASGSGDLYVGTARYAGGEVWRMTSSGWAKINKPGFGTAKNYYVNFLIFYNNGLYAGTLNEDKGAQVWKYVGPSVSNWKAVGVNGMGDPDNRCVASAAVFGNPGYLYVITENSETGSQVLRTNGKKWEKANTPGFGEGPVNIWGSLLTVFDGKLYAALDSEFGGRVFATSGGATLPFAWSQVNEDGFTTNDNHEVRSAAFYGGKLYVGTASELGCEIWRYEGNGWTQVASGGFGDPYNYAAASMAVTNLGLHVGTINGVTGTEVWRYNGAKWTQANKDGFGDDTSYEAGAMFVSGGKLYVGTESYDTKGRVWRCDGPGTGQWTRVNNGGFGDVHAVGVTCFTTFDGKLYAGTYTSNDPCRVWRFDGPGPANWTPVSEDGFGDTANHGVYVMAVYKGALYAGVWNARMTGCEIWRYSGSGTSWTKVNQNGFGTKDNNTPETMIVFGNLLYVGTGNGASGGQIWAYDGSAWTKSGNSGFGTNNNWAISALISDGHNLYAGTENGVFGCEVWTSGAGNDSPLVRTESPFKPARKARRSPRRD
jgi:hypothetical protein